MPKAKGKLNCKIRKGRAGLVVLIIAILSIAWLSPLAVPKARAILPGEGPDSGESYPGEGLLTDVFGDDCSGNIFKDMAKMAANAAGQKFFGFDLGDFLFGGGGSGPDINIKCIYGESAKDEMGEGLGKAQNTALGDYISYLSSRIPTYFRSRLIKDVNTDVKIKEACMLGLSDEEGCPTDEDFKGFPREAREQLYKLIEVAFDRENAFDISEGYGMAQYLKDPSLGFDFTGSRADNINEEAIGHPYNLLLTPGDLSYYYYGRFKGEEVLSRKRFERAQVLDATFDTVYKTIGDRITNPITKAALKGAIDLLKKTYLDKYFSEGGGDLSDTMRIDL